MKPKSNVRTLLLLAAVAALLFAPALQAAKPLAEPARIDLSVSPTAVRAGERVQVTVALEAKPGVKINRYPNIKVVVPARDGLVGEGKAAMGGDPPPPDKMDKNYFEKIDPLQLTLTVDPEAPAGKHEIEGKLSFAYCVIKSGFCAPKRVPVKFPVTVR